jgi:arginyl-tRNA synthetase
MYQRLGGIHFDHILGESFYIDKSKEIITEGQKTGVITTGEGGALLFFFPNDQYPPLMVQRSDGATLYASRDLAQVKYRSQTWNIIKNIITTDSAQELHFKQYFTAAKIMGLNKTKEGETELVHVCFGRMSFRDQKMSTRKGNILLLADVLDEAEERALTLIQSKESNLNPAEQRELARIMGIGSIKYNILSQNRLTNIVFDWDKMLSFEGNAAPYIQYTYARARSILRKTKSIETLRLPAEYNLNQAEREILCLFSRFPSILLQSAREYYPHLLSNFLYELTQKFNTFYNSTPVLNAPTDDQRHFRLLLVDKTSIVIKKIMRILGIEVPEKM